MIKQLYIEYIQKSRIFLYPALDIKRGSSVTPIETYISWKDHYSVDDNKLICLYHIRQDQEFKTFEKIKLFANPKFDDFQYVGEEKAVYVFDLSLYKYEFSAFVEGKYSKFNEDYKQNVLSFFKQSKTHQEYIDSYLYPDKYIDKYAEILSSDDFKTVKAALVEVGELCEKPDFEKEDLKLELLELDLTK
jgi:hypothetical protein